MTTLTPGPFIWAAELITLLGIAARPSKYRRLLFLLVAPLCIYPMFLPKAATSHDNYARTGRLISLLLVSSDFLVLTDVQNELRLRNDKASPHISQRSWWSRLKWAFQLRTSMRGVGWSFEPSPEHLGPRPPVRTRWEFIIYQLIWTAFNSLALDLCVATAKTIPYFDGTGRETLATAPWPDKLLCWLYIAISYHGLLVPFRIMTILSVGLGLSQPHEWPELFGNPLDAYTVRRAWGRVWQQSIRRILTVHADFLAFKVFHLPRKGIVSRYFRLFASFFVSGLLHYMADCMALRHTDSVCLRTFLLHACAITFEDLVAEVAKRLGRPIVPTLVTRMVGRVWVVVWFSWCMAPWLTFIVSSGIIQDNPDLKVGTKVIEYIRSM